MRDPIRRRPRLRALEGALLLSVLVAGCSREPELPSPIEEAVFLLNLEPARIALDGEPGVELMEPASQRVMLRPFGIGSSTRKCLSVARGSEVAFRSVLEPGAKVRFEIGFDVPAAGASPPVGGGASYSLQLVARDATGEEAVLWSEELLSPVPGEELPWRRIECASPFESGDIVLRTGGAPEPRVDDYAPGWANPRIVPAEPRPAPPLADRRNTIVFLVDTLRADHIGPMGYERGATPTLDEIALQSILFTQASSAAPWTKASVASVMTSRLPSRHGAEGVPDRLRDSEVTLARIFAEAGYDTGAVGFNTWIFHPRFNVTSGFQDVIEVFDTERDGGARADSVVAEAVDWILRRGDRPFFLYVHAIDPHEPYIPAAGERARFVPPYEGPLTGLLDGAGSHLHKKRSEVTPADVEHVQALYDAEIAFMDRMLGQFVQRLDELGLWDETAFVFTADHGEEFLEHGHWSHGGKLYEHQIHVPLLLKPPASAGLDPRVRRDPVSLIDVAPTLLELAGIPRPPTFAGQSLLSYGDGVRRSAPIVAEVHKDDMYALAVRDGDRKFIQVLSPRPREELFDLASDPGEQRNLLSETDPELVETLRRFAAAHWAGARASGLYVELLGDGTPASVQVHVESADPALDHDLVEVEKEGDSFRTRSTPRGNRVIVARLTLDAEDRRDILLLAPQAGTVLELAVKVNEESLDPSHILVGPGQQPMNAARWKITADAPELLADAPPAPMEGRPGVWCRVWQVRTVEEAPVEFDGEMLESLRALGYVR